MARVTVEDCLKNVKNRFELVIIAAKRARQLMRGKEAKVEWDNDKSTVVALREIAAGYTDFDNHEHTEHHKEEEHQQHTINIHPLTERREPSTLVEQPPSNASNEE